MVTVNSNFTNIQFNTSLGVTCEMTIDNVFQDITFEFITTIGPLNVKDTLDIQYMKANELMIYLNDKFPQEDHEDILNFIRIHGDHKMKKCLSL